MLDVDSFLCGKLLIIFGDKALMWVLRSHINHENEHVLSIEQGEARRSKYKRLKLGGGQTYDRSSD
jgi:hypothetical protein